jgi:hypothetical protein
MDRRMTAEAHKLVYTLADMHVVEAANLITTGAVSGANHVASKPYEPPNSDTHVLDRSGHVRARGPLQAESVFDAPYAADLEFGTENMIERPFARPAAKIIRKRVDRLAEAAVKRINKGGTL